MIVLPEKCLKTVWDDAKGIHIADPSQKLSFTWGDREQEFWWANGIEYDWKDTKGKHRMILHVVVCHEKWEENGKEKESTWAWVSGKAINEKNILDRCNGAARHRWGIEEQILAEKKRGYNYEHMFSYDWNGMKGWHAIMQLGHLINTLTLHTVAFGIWRKGLALMPPSVSYARRSLAVGWNSRGCPGFQQNLNSVSLSNQGRLAVAD